MTPQWAKDYASRTGRTVDDVLEQHAERAAIREYLAGLPRDEAEKLAAIDVVGMERG